MSDMAVIRSALASSIGKSRSPMFVHPADFVALCRLWIPWRQRLGWQLTNAEWRKLVLTYRACRRRERARSRSETLDRPAGS